MLRNVIISLYNRILFKKSLSLFLPLVLFSYALPAQQKLEFVIILNGPYKEIHPFDASLHWYTLKRDSSYAYGQQSKFAHMVIGVRFSTASMGWCKESYSEDNSYYYLKNCEAGDFYLGISERQDTAHVIINPESAQNDNKFLIPGNRKEIYPLWNDWPGDAINTALTPAGKVVHDKFDVYVKKYSLTVINSDIEEAIVKYKDRKNIKDMPSLFFYGFINNDQLPDLIIREVNESGTERKETFYLYLSDSGKKKYRRLEGMIIRPDGIVQEHSEGE